MAVQGAGLGKGPDGDAFKDQQHFDARNGAAKRTQTDFPIAKGMKDQTQFSRVGPGATSSGPPNPAYHFGPDASSANPSDPTEQVRVLRRQPAEGAMRSPWGMVDANGKGVDNSIGVKVLGEARLPASASEAK